MTKSLSQLIDEPELACRVGQDLIKRTKGGEFAYPLVWFICGFASDFHQSHTLLFSLMLVVFSVATIFRVWTQKILDRYLPNRVNEWENIMLASLALHPLGWGSMFGYSMLIENNLFSAFLAFSSAGLCAAGGNAFAPSAKLSRGFIILFLLPPLIIDLIWAHTFVIALLISAFLIYMLGLTTRQRQEYWRALENEIKLAKQSRTDALTELDNRRYFEEKLDELCHLSSRNHEQLAVVVIDCDNFKAINDNYGHDIGDLCLKHLAKTLSKTLARVTDVLARYGGEEFTVLLPGTDRQGAELVCEKIRRAVERSVLILEDGEINLTVSVGCVARQLGKFEPGLPEQLFKQADIALYEAKKNGRNCCFVVTYNEEDKTYTEPRKVSLNT